MAATAPTASRCGRSRNRPQSGRPCGHLASISSASARMIAARSTGPSSTCVADEAERQHVGMTVAGPPHDRRHERQLVVREAVELGAEQDVGHVLVAVHHVEAPADVENTSGVIDRRHDARRRARLERTLELRRRRPAGATPPLASIRRTARRGTPARPPSPSRVTRWRSSEARARCPRARPDPRPGCVWRARTPPASEWPRRRRQSNRLAPR